MRSTQAVMALAVLLAASAAAAPPITKIESRSLPPEVVTHRVLDQLADILVPPQPWPKDGAKPQRPLYDLSYTTLPRAAELAGLCQTDQVQFSFEPVSGTEAGADTNVKVVGVHATPAFHFVTAPSAQLANATLTPADKRALDGRCKGLPRDAKYFQAASWEDVRDAVEALRSVRGAAASGLVPPVFDCDVSKPDMCKSAVNLRPDDIMTIESCGADPATSAECTEIWGLVNGDWGAGVSLRIVWKREGGALKIVKVRVGEVVTTADLRAD